LIPDSTFTELAPSKFEIVKKGSSSDLLFVLAKLKELGISVLVD